MSCETAGSKVAPFWLMAHKWLVKFIYSKYLDEEGDFVSSYFRICEGNMGN